MVPRKSSTIGYMITVPKTNTRRLVENTKVDGVTMLKELGKTAVVTSG